MTEMTEGVMTAAEMTEDETVEMVEMTEEGVMTEIDTIEEDESTEMDMIEAAMTVEDVMIAAARGRVTVVADLPNSVSGSKATDVLLCGIYRISN